MGIGLKLFGGSNKASGDNRSGRRASSASSSEQLAVERALKFAKKAPPKYNHAKKEAIEHALLALERSVLAIDATKSLLEESCSLFKSAVNEPDSLDDAKRTLLVAQMERTIEQLTSFVNSAAVDNLNLVDGRGSHLVVELSEATTGQLVIRRINLTPSGMGLSVPESSYAKVSDVQVSLNTLERALDYVRTENQTFCANATILAEHYPRL